MKNNWNYYDKFNKLDSESLREKMKICINKYDTECRLELLIEIETICQILKERILS